MSWLGQLFSRRRRYDELSESIREHLDEKIADLMDRGMTQDQAEQAARREFGNVTRIEERSREVWQWPTVELVLADVKLSLRRLRNSPGFTMTVILTLGHRYRRQYGSVQRGEWRSHQAPAISRAGTARSAQSERPRGARARRLQRWGCGSQPQCISPLPHATAPFSRWACGGLLRRT